MKKRSGPARFAVALVVTFVLHGAAVEAGDAQTFTSFLTGSQEVPPVQTSAVSFAVFTFLANDTLLFGYRLNFLHDQTVTGVHIHDGAFGVDAPIIINIRPDGICLDLGGFLTIYYLTAAQLRGSLAGMTLTDLRNKMQSGDTYLNLHTAENPGGWIRGQMMPVLEP